eukprot:2951735-Amphidinium_carterae.1
MERTDDHELGCHIFAVCYHDGTVALLDIMQLTSFEGPFCAQPAYHGPMCFWRLRPGRAQHEVGHHPHHHPSPQPGELCQCGHKPKIMH